MSDSEAVLARTREALGAFPPALQTEFAAAAEALAGTLSAAELRDWAADGLLIARRSLRSWETASEYFRASPALLEQLPFDRFRQWSGSGAALLEASPALAGSFFRASPLALRHLSPTQGRDWAEQGRSLYKGSWKSGSLAAQFFETSPQVLPHLPLGQTRLLVEVIDALAAHSYELAGACLTMAPTMLEQLDRPDRAPFLEFGAVVANTAWVDARVYFERGPSLLRQVQPQQRARFLALSGRVALQVGRLGHPYYMEAAQALATVERETHGLLLELSEQLAPNSGVAAMEFLKASPDVLRRLRPPDVARWQEAGRAILAASPDGGEAYFRLESAKGEEVIDALSSRVELERVGALIRMYCKALSGVDVAVRSVEELAEKGVGWVEQSGPTTEGTAIYLPPIVDAHAAKAENFAVYKVFATHQAARLEFGSFLFRYDRPGQIFADGSRAQRAGGGDGDGAALTDMQRFFDLFEDRRLAHDIFAVVEDTRVDTLVKREYAGIRQALGRLQREAAQRRRPVEGMPARQAMVENLVRASLGEAADLRWPVELAALMQEPLHILTRLRAAGATVEDSAEATLLLYDWLTALPNVELDTLSWRDLPTPPPDAEAGDEDSPRREGEGKSLQESLLPSLPSAEEQPYQSPEAVDFRGAFKPELVQLLMMLKADDVDSEAPLVPLTKEQLQELLEKSGEIDLSELTEDGNLAESADIFLDNLLREVAQSSQPQTQPGGQTHDGSTPTGDDEGPLPEAAESFYYDEWDFRAHDYKPRWCRVQELRLASGGAEYYEETLVQHASLVRETRLQFEQLKPELFRKIKHLQDGEDYDLDAVVEWFVGRRARHSTDGRLFYRRNKVERDVAVAFLLDMSASTDEEISKHRPPGPPATPGSDDPRQHISWWAQRRAAEAQSSSKRIIDLEKEALVILIEALETIGDSYGVYGFSGYGRENVEFYVIKELDESLSASVKERIGKIAPVRSTRMGPAIRHCTQKLKESGAKVKIVILLSDGRPQDHGYGRDRTEKEYAIHDTKMALTEVRRAGMTPFCLTVDRAGHDYLQQMCEDMGYEIVSDIESLPRRLPALYRRLTQ